MNFQTMMEELNRLYEADENTAEEVEAVEEVEATEEAGEVETAEDEEIELEVVDDEADEEKDVQLVLECANCGGIIVNAEIDVEVDEETDLANVKEKCRYCDEADGFKILGTMAPYASEEPEIEEVEEGLFDFGKKKREAELARQEAEEARRKAEQEKSKTKWPTAADYEKYEQEQREARRIEKEMAKYKAMGKDWNKSSSSSSPSNTPYVGVNYSGGDYF